MKTFRNELSITVLSMDIAVFVCWGLILLCVKKSYLKQISNFIRKFAHQIVKSNGVCKKQYISVVRYLSHKLLNASETPSEDSLDLYALLLVVFFCKDYIDYSVLCHPFRYLKFFFIVFYWLRTDNFLLWTIKRLNCNISIA